ncbi:MAG: UDP-N-acetylglucosamine--undecaprenyl-phosphate N-acetylglucosaminephosphotransferase [Gammaproteobacteria bacterium]|nr:UDP-N-acetylglucosamine--undecaprenyl-phosphate N-acetylglucosaminephosphotransferase [Gammaproteobacteria bacterium]MBU1724337.1 UDP-N-acetylglucosamine--undecaprenyl-phosphate N-acetylglucosaminephosphotransferase [Gammaproteobacteria bacterium]MBU2006235.1 UDP-N-acetylglucosamine--undecaprenyl-phosphate N-acetylglucosaminephosphotransferase [Gammaproteobacteria bacterium]
MILFGVALVVAFMSALSIFLLSPYADRVGLVDVPNHRKLHSGNIPLVGGISVYVGLASGIMLLTIPGMGFTTYLVCSSLIVVLGVMDDSWEISPKIRLVVQGLVALIMYFGAGLYISHAGNLFGLGEIYLGNAGILLTVIAVIAGINAFNMIDGVDGLLGISSLITFLALAVLFLLNSDMNGVYLSLLMVVALLPYLAANMGFSPLRVQKIFMGDTGSMLIGLTVVWLLVRGSQGGQPSFSISTALWLIAFPLMDMVRVMLWRIRAGKPVFEADRTHLHHLLSRGSSRHSVLVKICSLSALFAVVGVVLEVSMRSPQKDAVIFLLFIASFVVYMVRLGKLEKKQLI